MDLNREERSRTPSRRRPHRRTAPKRAARREQEAQARVAADGARDITAALNVMLNRNRNSGTFGRRIEDTRDGYPFQVYLTSAHIPEFHRIAITRYADGAAFQRDVGAAVQGYLDKQPRAEAQEGGDEDYEDEIRLDDFWEYEGEQQQIGYTLDRSNVRYNVQVSYPQGIQNRGSVGDLLARPLRAPKPLCPEHMWKKHGLHPLALEPPSNENCALVQLCEVVTTRDSGVRKCDELGTPLGPRGA